MRILMGLPSQKAAESEKAAAEVLGKIERKQGEKKALDALRNIGELLGRPNGHHAS